MDRVDAANKLVEQCERAIRELIEDALANRQYEEIQYLASLALAVATANATAAAGALETGSTQSSIANVYEVQPVRSSVKSQTKVAPRARRRRAEYPKFERRGDRLVKIGWSKRHRAEYEHKASYETIASVIQIVNKASSDGGYLRMEDIVPMVDRDGEEVPSYQVYLVVAWLRDLGILERQGNDGYRLQDANSNLNVEVLWDQTTNKD